MNLRDEWRERVAEALEAASRDHSRGRYPESLDEIAETLLAPGGVVAGIVAEALREAADAWTQGQWSDVMLPKPTPPAVPVIAYANRMGDWLRGRATTAQNPPSDGRVGSGEGAGPSDGAEGVERGEG